VTGAVPPIPSGWLAKAAWHLRHNPKADLWVAWWSIPIAYNIMGAVYFTITHMMPPPDATKSQTEVVEFFTRYGFEIRLGFGIMLVSLAFLVWANGLIGWLIMKMDLPHAKAWGYAYMIAMCGGGFTGAYMSAFTMSVASLRPDRDPAMLQLLYDATYISFDGTMGFFLFGSLIWTYTILADKSRLFPKWFGYTCIWNFTTEFLVSPAVIVQAGPFSWNGTIAFWIDTIVYIAWQIIYVFMLYYAVKRVDPPKDGFRAARLARLLPRGETPRGPATGLTPQPA